MSAGSVQSPISLNIGPEPMRAAAGRGRRHHRSSIAGGLIFACTYMIARVHAFDVLGDPIRRRILELLAEGERPAGAVADVIGREYGISQPAVSQHLRVLRDSGFATVRPDGARRLYAVHADALHEVDAWLDRFRTFWTPRLDALATELARGAGARRAGQAESSSGRNRRSR